jgi:phosphohistidine swiveling domain-containing protein
LDPLRRAEACEVGLEALELAVLVQPEISPEAGGVARTEPAAGAGGDLIIEGVQGHPGALLSGWAEGARDAGLVDLIGADAVADVASLAGRVYSELGDDLIEWAVADGQVWLLQSARSGRGAVDGGTPVPAERGISVLAQPAAPGTAAGPLVPCRPHQSVDCRDAILLVDRPVPGLAPLLFGARGVISRSGAAGSHLAEVARSLGVPMVTGCRTETVTGPAPALGTWSAMINGTTGEVALLPPGQAAPDLRDAGG